MRSNHFLVSDTFSALYVAVNCFTFWNLVWICEGFWQIFALECALCCCMLIVIGQWTLTLACLACTLATLGVILTKDLSSKGPISCPPKKSFICLLLVSCSFLSSNSGMPANVCKWVKSGRLARPFAGTVWATTCHVASLRTNASRGKTKPGFSASFTPVKPNQTFFLYLSLEQ